jgi:predicted DNA-binding protein (MmcQ/YjbR family)
MGMSPDAVRDYCLRKAGTDSGRPFGPDVLVVKVAGKIFAILADAAEPPTVSLKCEPEVAVLLRRTYPGVLPGYHLNKQHWNTVTLGSAVPDDELRGWIDDSYDLVVDTLPKKVRATLRPEATPSSRNRRPSTRA